MRILFLCLLLLQVSFAMDPSIEAALRCIEKKKFDAFSVEKIDGKVYAGGMFIPDDDDACGYKTVSGSSVFEIKNNCIIEKKRLVQKRKNCREKRFVGSLPKQQ